MINFRFHIASLVAVFLALALGIVIGSTVVDRAIVDNLNKRINDIEKRANDTSKENNKLASDIELQQDYLDKVKSYAVVDQLDGVPVVPLAVRGIDESPVSDTVELAREAGATVPGVLWLEPKLALEDDDTVKELATILGDPSLTRREARTTLWQALATRLRTGADVSGDRDLLSALVDAGFLQFQAIGDTPSGFSLANYPDLGSRVLLVAGTGEELTVDETVLPLARVFANDDVPLVVGEVYLEEDGGPARGESVAPVRGDDALTNSVSTVDDLDKVQGRIAAVLALSDFTRGVVGNYGEGDGVTAPLPALAAAGS